MLCLKHALPSLDRSPPSFPPSLLLITLLVLTLYLTLRCPTHLYLPYFVGHNFDSSPTHLSFLPNSSPLFLLLSLSLSPFLLSLISFSTLLPFPPHPPCLARLHPSDTCRQIVGYPAQKILCFYVIILWRVNFLVKETRWFYWLSYWAAN